MAAHCYTRSVPVWIARIIAYLFVGIVCAAGPVLLLIATITGIEKAIFVHSSVKTDGVVFGMRPVYERRSNKTWYPVFQFTAKDGRSFTVTSDVGERPFPWRPPQQVTILYDPDNPENARIDSFAQLWMPQAVLGTVGGGFATIPLLVLIRWLRLRKKSTETT